MRARAMIVATALGCFVVAPALPAGAGGGGGYCPPTAYYATAPGDSVEVRMKNACFTPTVLHVAPGTEVTFTNADPFLHNLSGPAGSFAEGLYKDLRKGDSVGFSLTGPGVFPYMCYLHPGMAGAIVVGDGNLDLAAPLSGGSGDAGEGSAGGVEATSTAADSTSSAPLALALGIALVLLIAAIASLAVGRRRALAGS